MHASKRCDSWIQNRRLNCELPLFQYLKKQKLKKNVFMIAQHMDTNHLVFFLFFSLFLLSNKYWTIYLLLYWQSVSYSQLIRNHYIEFPMQSHIHIEMKVIFNYQFRSSIKKKIWTMKIDFFLSTPEISNCSYRYQFCYGLRFTIHFLSLGLGMYIVNVILT